MAPVQCSVWLDGGLFAMLVARRLLLPALTIPVPPNSMLHAVDVLSFSGQLSVVVVVTPSAGFYPVLVQSLARALSILVVRGEQAVPDPTRAVFR